MLFMYIFCPMYKRDSGEGAASHINSTEIPLPYVFSRRFVEDYPSINATSAAAMKLLASLKSVRQVLDMQLFLGPAGK